MSYEKSKNTSSASLNTPVHWTVVSRHCQTLYTTSQ